MFKIVFGLVSGIQRQQCARLLMQSLGHRPLPIDDHWRILQGAQLVLVQVLTLQPGDTHGTPHDVQIIINRLADHSGRAPLLRVACGWLTLIQLI